MKLYGEGEWKVRLHGAEKRRTWRKLHLLIDHTTHEAVALSMTDKDVLDRGELPGLLRGVEGEVAKVLGDGAYDFHDCYKAIHARGARAVTRRRCGRGLEAGLSSAIGTRPSYGGARSGVTSGRRRQVITGALWPRRR